MKYVIVSSINIDRDTYTPLLDKNGEIEISDEVIDLHENKLFSACEDFYDVETTYENFWNRYSGDYRNSNIIKVLQVRSILDEVLGRKANKEIQSLTVRTNLLSEFRNTSFEAKDSLNFSKRIALH